jgi:hypothetical protein
MRNLTWSPQRQDSDEDVAHLAKFCQRRIVVETDVETVVERGRRHSSLRLRGLERKYFGASSRKRKYELHSALSRVIVRTRGHEIYFLT